MELKNRTWLIVIVLIRVIVTLGIMMTLFLGMWIGYFTIPIILIGVFSVILAISDMGILLSLQNDKDSSLEKSKNKSIKNDLIGKDENIINDDKQ